MGGSQSGTYHVNEFQPKGWKYYDVNNKVIKQDLKVLTGETKYEEPQTEFSQQWFNEADRLMYNALKTTNEELSSKAEIYLVHNVWFQKY